MQAHLKLLSCASLCAALLGCGGSDHERTQAERAAIGTVAQATGPTPFIAQLSYSLRDFSQVASIHFRIDARPGSHTRPISVTYEHAWLARRNAWDAAAGTVTIPVFGLYAAHRNALTVTTSFRDGSAHVHQVTVQSAAYSGPATAYASPQVRTARGAASPGFDYMLLTNGLPSPMIIDTDGQLRWVGTESGNSFSSLFGSDAMYIGNQSMPVLYRMDVDGSLRSTTLSDPKYANFHHELARGKSGLLAQLDVRENGVLRLESTLAEIDTSGQVLKEWDLSRIFRDAMRAGGDDPANFVRDGIDWFHSNSAIYDREDNAILVSSRENFVVKLDYDSGAIRWILGDPAKHWYVNYPSLRALALRVVEGKVPIGQHALSVLANRDLLLFNNGYASANQPAGTPAGTARGYSAPSRYAIDEQARTAREVWTWDADRQLYSDICSSVYEAAPGHYLIAYSALDARTTLRLVGMNEVGNIAFDFLYPTTLSSFVFSAHPVALDGLTLR